MPSQRRLHAQVGSLAVANLANHDDVRVLAKQCAQSRSEGHASFGVSLGLVDAGDFILDRILNC